MFCALQFLPQLSSSSLLDDLVSPFLVLSPPSIFTVGQHCEPGAFGPDVLTCCVRVWALPSFSSCFSPSPCQLLCSRFWGPHNQLAQTQNFHILPEVLHPSFITVSSSSSAEIWCFALLSQCLPRAGATPVSKLEKPPMLQYSSGWCRAPGAQSAARKGHCKVSSQENSANPLKSSEFTTWEIPRSPAPRRAAHPASHHLIASSAGNTYIWLQLSATALQTHKTADFPGFPSCQHSGLGAGFSSIYIKIQFCYNDVSKPTLQGYELHNQVYPKQVS